MPGILPMKVIKVGSSSQTRIAQACDRCRSKKIRCDGVRPSCTQCTNVGFECKTSDKLSRRAFPRGYTESLEERVRILESEVRDLKDLLDEKDEKIDMLSRISASSTVPRRTSNSPPPTSERESQDDDTFKVQQSPLLLNDENSESYFAGVSSGRTLIEAFKQKAQESGHSCSDVDLNAFDSQTAASHSPKRINQKTPPRLISDKMINIFFQEWAPLFPVLHRPTFLALYEQYVANPEAMSDKSIAQLNLVFGIAALSSDPRDGQDVESFEAQWHSALESFLMDNDVVTLQSLVLAQIFCLVKPDYSRLLKYKGLAVGLAQRLGLHQSQKRFALGALTSETRKKVFWSLYAVDCLSAAHLGMPKLLQEKDVHCEYPVDADDEYVTEKGFMPTLPGEFTKLSSALALFRVCRILSKVLTELYPASTSNEISFRAMASLADELEDWSTTLAPHLKLTFQQDRPSTNVTSSRSPILSLAYHHIRSLIYRPAVVANLGDKGSSALVAVGDACKHIVQIVQLLDERKLSFSFCLNRNEVLTQAGFGLLFQTLNLDRDGKHIKKLVSVVVDMLEHGNAAGAQEFKRIAVPPSPAVLRQGSEGTTMGAPMGTFRATQNSLKALAARFSPGTIKKRQDLFESRRATLATISPSMGAHPNPSASSLSSIRSEPPVARSEPTLSPLSHRPSIYRRTSNNSALRANNLDYLCFNQDPLANFTRTSASDWERLLSSLDNGQTNIYDTIYGGPPADALLDCPSLSASTNLTWSPSFWTDTTNQTAPPPQSVGESFSDESLTSGEDYGNSCAEFGSTPGSDGMYQGILIPEMGTPNSYTRLGGLDGNFGL